MVRYSQQGGQRPVSATTATEEKVSSTDRTLANYLDAMLHEATRLSDETAPEPVDSPESDKTEARPAAKVIPVPVTRKVRASTETVKPQLKTLPAEVKLKGSLTEKTEVKDAPLAAKEPAVESLADGNDHEQKNRDSWLDNGRPAWAQQRFDCLVFVVDGLKLAVPLLLLGNIHKLDRELTPLFDQPKWFLGLLPLQQERTIKVVDTAKLVMPERYRPESADDLAFAVGVHESDWAFGCHRIEGSITLEPEQVKWRSSRTSRPWLAGTVIDEMCALVDLYAFARQLSKK